MKPKIIKKFPKSKSFKSNKLKGGVAFIQGPLDSFVHTGKSNEDLKLHYDELNSKSANLQTKISNEVEKINNKLNFLENKKNADDNERNARFAENTQSIRDMISARQTETQNSRLSLQAMFSYVAKFLTFIVKVLVTIGRFLWNCGKVIILAISAFVSWISNLLERWGVRIWQLFAIILIIIIIIIGVAVFILWIWYLIISGGDTSLEGFGNFLTSIFVPKNKDDTTKCTKKKKCTGTFEISITNFTDWFNDANKYLSDRYDEMMKLRPNFPSIPDIPTFDFMKPWNSFNDYMDYQSSLLQNNRLVRNLSTNFDYVSNVVTGGEYKADKIQRDVLTNGRCDNTVFIQPELIKQELINNRNINLATEAINITRPLDIEWELPELDYKNKDVSQLPTFLFEQENNEGISLKDKKKIVIPWMKKDNKYVLSCSDAYFKNNPSEKVNILIDNSENTCIFNTDTKSNKFNEEKERYIYTNDLSHFI